MTVAGEAIGPVRLAPVDPELMKTMAVVLDDPNLIHLDPKVVSELGFGDRVINQGPSNCGYVIDVLLDTFPGTRLARFAAKFVGNVFGGDTLTVQGTVEEADDAKIVCRALLTNQVGDLVLHATAVLESRG